MQGGCGLTCAASVLLAMRTGGWAVFVARYEPEGALRVGASLPTPPARVAE